MDDIQYSPQITKVLDTNTARKRNLKNIYMLVAQCLDLMGLEKAQRDEVFGNMLEVTKKLAKVADAVDEYEKLEKKEIARIIKEAKAGGNPELIVAEHSSKLEAAAEEALSQGKSMLDVLVKLLRPVIGISLNTYGGGGVKVGKAIRNNTSKDLIDRAEFLINLVEQESEQKWMKLLKKYRDDHHYKNLGITPIRAKASGENERPIMPGGQSVAEFLSVLYICLFTFATDFIACTLSIRLPKAIGLYAEGEDLNKEVKLGIVNLPAIDQQ